MMALLAGLTLGLASSAHCAAMCGPLVLTVGRRLALPSRRGQLTYALVHHAGRVLTYAVLALPAGLAGEMLAVRGFGRALAVVAGIVLLGAAIGSIRLRVFDGVTSRVASIVARASSPILRWGATRPVIGPFVTGALHGLLPCGLVYAALMAAGAAGNVTSAVLLMAGFGIGTSAVLVAIAMGAAAMSPALRVRLRPIIPLVLAVTAVILIARGVGTSHRHQGPPVVAGPHHQHERWR